MEVPAAMPDTIPDAGPIVATPGNELDHVPPDGVDESVLDAPGHMLSVPVIGVGAGFIVTVNARVSVPFSGQLSSLNVR